MRAKTLVGTLVVGALAAGQVGATQAAALTEHGYVTTEVKVPLTSAEARSYGRDFTGDGIRDNRMGQVFASLASQGMDMAAIMDEAITSGDIVMLHSLRANSLATTRNATWQVWYGEPTPNPDLTGSGSFNLLSGQPHSSKIAATIKDHKVTTAAGTVPLRLDFGAGVFKLRLSKAKIFATCFHNSCSDGRIAGAVSKQQVDTVIVHQLAVMAQAFIDQDCPGPGPDSCAADSTGKTMQNIFDTDDNLEVTDEEVLNNSLFQSLFAMDVDLVDEPGPAVKDHLSFGVGFATIKATLVRPT